MIIALLILIALILLFGVVAVKGWIRGLAAVIACGLIVLISIVFAVGRYQHWQEGREHQSLVRKVKPIILEAVARKANVRQADLIDIAAYDQGSNVYLCGLINGTTGYGGPNGRRRFLSDGGNTELEKPNDKSEFTQREALHCTADTMPATIL